MVSTHLKNISQNGNLPQVGVKIKIFETTNQKRKPPKLSTSPSPSRRLLGPTCQWKTFDCCGVFDHLALVERESEPEIGEKKTRASRETPWKTYVTLSWYLGPRWPGCLDNFYSDIWTSKEWTYAKLLPMPIALNSNRYLELLWRCCGNHFDFYIPGGAGFLPSTVVSNDSVWTRNHHPVSRFSKYMLPISIHLSSKLRKISA